MVNEFPQAQMPGEGGRQEQTGIVRMLTKRPPSVDSGLDSRTSQ